MFFSTTTTRHGISCYRSYDNCHQIGFAYLDLDKAFDSVPHNSITLECRFHRFPLAHFKAYSTNTCQCVVIDGHCTDCMPSDCMASLHQLHGCLRVSILGPLFLFCILIDLTFSLSFSKPFSLLTIQNVANEFLLHQATLFYRLILIHFGVGALKVDYNILQCAYKCCLL